MSKGKTEAFKIEGERRAKLRKDDRKVKRKAKKTMYNKLKLALGERGCRGCGEDPYCYCGDGTPYSY